MAERSFVTLAIDLPFRGENGGTPHNTVLPDIYSEVFSAAMDYLGTWLFVDRNKISVKSVSAAAEVLPSVPCTNGRYS